MADERTIRVEVVYALPDRQRLQAIDVPRDCTVRQAVERSGLLQEFPEIDLDDNPVGIFARRCAPDDPLRDGDRVEIYRPLKADPKEVRRELAAQGRTMGRTTGRGDPD